MTSNIPGLIAGVLFAIIVTIAVVGNGWAR